jgi:threonine/homoserine/homoserine lactone efflux protein
MPEPATFLLFLAAASAIALTPGPGILYAAARTLAGGRAEGLASSAGLGLGGMFHIAAGALGVSALVLASAQAFTLLKIAGAIYLVWLGIRTFREARAPLNFSAMTATGAKRAFGEGVIVEILNPKTAAFFLAFIPQFVDPERGSVALQFLILGAISVGLNTAVDIVVTFAAARTREGLGRRPDLIRRIRQASGAMLCALGAALALAKRPG